MEGCPLAEPIFSLNAQRALVSDKEQNHPSRSIDAEKFTIGGNGNSYTNCTFV